MYAVWTAAGDHLSDRHARALRQDLPGCAAPGRRNPRTRAIAAGGAPRADRAPAASVAARRQRHQGRQDTRHADGPVLRVVAAVLRPLRRPAVLRCRLSRPGRGGGGRHVARLLQQFHQPVRLRVPQPRLPRRLQARAVLWRRRRHGGRAHDDRRRRPDHGDVDG